MWADLRNRIGGGLSETECDALGRVAGAAPGKTALEVGHYNGLSTCVLLASLPQGSALWTIDHHGGDFWTPASSAAVFADNVDAWLGRVDLHPIFDDFAGAHEKVPVGIDFLFYDADHTAEACSAFWDLYGPRLAPDSVVVFDDSDWRGMGEFHSRAAHDGFCPVRTRPVMRCAIGKKHRAAYTLCVMVRDEPQPLRQKIAEVFGAA